MQKIDRVTKEKFSFAWSNFAQDEVKEAWHKDSFHYIRHIPDSVFYRKIGLDAGCGSGSDAINISKRHAAKVVAFDIHDHMEITEKNIQEARDIALVRADISNPPFKLESFDFAYCFGVLHHLINPEEAFKRLSGCLKRGGHLIIYVYEDFSERSSIERAALKLVSLLRGITRRIPSAILYAICFILTPVVWICCSLPAAIMVKFRATRAIAERIPYRHTLNPACIVADLYDRFSPPIEKRYNRNQVKQWFLDESFEDVSIINIRGWVAWGKKR